MKKDHILFILSILAAFFILFAGAWSSPTFEEQQSYIQAIVTFGSLLFIFSAVIIIAAIGFYSFALYLSLFLAMAISLYGYEAGIIVIAMTYAVWGLVFSLQILLVNAGSEGALNWFREHYTFRAFEIEYRVFYPMLWIFYFLLEYLPDLLLRGNIISFYPGRIYRFMRHELKRG